MKLIAFDAIEGGIVIHPTVGKAKVVPVSDDEDRVAAALGAMVLAILQDEAQPDVEDDDDDEEDEPPRAKRKRRAGPTTGARARDKLDIPGPQPGESADDFVHRAAAQVGVTGFKALWKGLQKVSRG